MMTHHRNDMILTHLVIQSFFDGAGGSVASGGVTGLPVLTLFHYFDGYTEAGAPSTSTGGSEYIIVWRRRRF
jgi:hypothetical protein